MKAHPFFQPTHPLQNAHSFLTGHGQRGVGLVLLVMLCIPVAADWPMWQGNPARTGTTPEPLPDSLSLLWSRAYAPIERTWPDEDRLDFDLAYSPVAGYGKVFIAIPQQDAVVALDANTGAECWRFLAGGPVRFAPALADGRLYAGSDDGALYCLDVETGGLVWRFDGAPSSRKVLGNTRMISVWPVRGAPVIADGVVYFSAGIWPFEGVFLYALDAKTGAVQWSNDQCDVPYIPQPHRGPAFAGLAPQGYLAVAGSKLLVPNGRSVAACVDRTSGVLDYFRLEPSNRHGSYRVTAAGERFFNPRAVYDLATGNSLGDFPAEVAITQDTVFGVGGNDIKAWDYPAFQVKEHKDKDGDIEYAWEMPVRWKMEFKDAIRIMVAGSRLYVASPGRIAAVDPPKDKAEPAIAWETPVEGTPRNLAASEGRLIAATQEGVIYVFGDAKAGKKGKTAKKGKGAPASILTATPEPAPENPAASARVKALLESVSDRAGYAWVWGASDLDLLGSLAKQSSFHIVCTEPDAARAESARKALDAQGLYGGRIAIINTASATFDAPPYWASFIIALAPDQAWDAAAVTAITRALHPYGGVACAAVPADARERVTAWASETKPAGIEIAQGNDGTLIKRPGALPGSGSWTHQYGDAANTATSPDDLVRAPLGMLWYGGSSNIEVLPRHGHGPPEQVLDGRLFIQGPDGFRAMDVYTGRILWRISLPGIGEPYNTTSHQPGANARGSNFTTAADGVYIVQGTECLRIDPATGKTLNTLTLPVPDGASGPPDWGFISTCDDLLIAGSGPIIVDDEVHGKTWNAVASKRLVVFERQSGNVLWTRTADVAFRHNAIAAGGGKLFCVDAATPEHIDRMKRRGIEVPDAARLIALDIRTGNPIWTLDTDVFGTWLSYAAPQDILLQAGRSSNDMLPDEPTDRMAAIEGATGKRLWEKKEKYRGPCLINGDLIIAQEQLFSLKTGDRVMHPNPVTLEEIPLEWGRTHGCNVAIASRHLLTFRSAAAGFYDLERQGGTGNFGGFRSGCTSNLIAADGVLNAPDYTRTCTCSYQIQTSLALVHTPAVEMWTFNPFEFGDNRLRRIGLNFGAPGDRRDDDGILWLEYPVVGGPSPDLPVRIEPENPVWSRLHSARFRGDGLNWVAASCGKGLTAVHVTVDKKPEKKRRYTVRLYAAEPDPQAVAGGRVFDVALQGKTVIEGWDLVQAAGGPRIAVMREFTGVEAKGEITVSLTARQGETVLSGIAIIEEE